MKVFINWSREIYSSVILFFNLIYKETISWFLNLARILHNGRKSDLVVSELDSQSKGCGFESRLIQILLDGNGLKAMLGSIPAPNSGSFMEK